MNPQPLDHESSALTTLPWLSPFLNQQLITNNIKSSNNEVFFFCISARQNNDYAPVPVHRDYANANDYVNAPALANRDLQMPILMIIKYPCPSPMRIPKLLSKFKTMTFSFKLNNELEQKKEQTSNVEITLKKK